MTLHKNIFLLTLIFGVQEAMALELTSSQFKNGDNLPRVYTCDGRNITPPLKWSDIPPGTKSFVLVMDDPDAPAGTWDHWIVYNIPANTTSFEENITDLPDGALVGKNSWGELAYGGPCPPKDKEHRYFFKLYAVDTLLPVQAGLSKQEVGQALNHHVLASTELMTRYQRAK